MVDIPSKLNWKTKSTFIVVTPFDLNTVSHRRIGINEEISKNFSFCYFDKGPNKEIKFKIRSRTIYNNRSIHNSKIIEL
ncbi:hypothetical protein HZH68_005105 [Vespula germanica]|uniref:Uncharacterized protein n=1 Tax=Vespula germanica TaxID=30212 RepID=A0A834KKH3_VESGE|nr:hypothetical protein HZH68_005105 [Vespula germanica]